MKFKFLLFEVGSVEEEERQIEQLIKLKNRNISLLGKRSRDTKNLDIEGLQDIHEEEERGSSTKSTAARNPLDVPIIKREILPSSDGQRECIGKPDGDVENQIRGKRIRRPNSLFEDSKLIVGPTPKRSSSFDLYPKIDERRNQGVVHNSVPVEQYHPTSGVVVHRYSSQREAAQRIFPGAHPETQLHSLVRSSLTSASPDAGRWAVYSEESTPSTRSLRPPRDPRLCNRGSPQHLPWYISRRYGGCCEAAGPSRCRTRPAAPPAGPSSCRPCGSPRLASFLGGRRSGVVARGAPSAGGGRRRIPTPAGFPPPFVARPRSWRPCRTSLGREEGHRPRETEDGQSVSRVRSYLCRYSGVAVVYYRR